jgi:hypothetical protein
MVQAGSPMSTPTTSTVSQVGLKPLVAADPGPKSAIQGNGTSGIIHNNQQIAFQANPAQPGKVQVLDDGITFDEFPIKKSVDTAHSAFFKNAVPAKK